MLCLLSLSHLRCLDMFSLDAVGSSAAVAIPLIVVAFNVNDFIVTPYYKRKAGMTSSPLLLVPDANPPEGHMMPVDTGVDGSALCFLEKYRTSLKMIK